MDQWLIDLRSIVHQSSRSNLGRFISIRSRNIGPAQSLIFKHYQHERKEFQLAGFSSGSEPATALSWGINKTTKAALLVIGDLICLKLCQWSLLSKQHRQVLFYYFFLLQFSLFPNVLTLNYFRMAGSHEKGHQREKTFGSRGNRTQVSKHHKLTL